MPHNKTYGTIAGAIIFLFFLRIVSTIILLGAEFNAEAARRYDPETIRDKMSDPKRTHLSDALGYLVWQETQGKNTVGPRNQPLL